MKRGILGSLLALALAGCTTVPSQAPPVEVQILALNDFHGNLEPPLLTVPTAHGPVPAGGAAYLGGALKQLRTQASLTVAAGDLIGATPITSALFLDEPAIAALSMAGLDLAAVGNHEFDRGWRELRRMQEGGCERFTTRQPCRLEPFKGAGFQYLAANVLDEAGRTLFPGAVIRDVGGVRIGVIGMTLKETASLVTPSAVAGLRFADEAATANALVPILQAQGAQAIVLVIHQGASIAGRHDNPTCPGLAGDVLPIIARLDPAVRLVVSGHTHNAYVCRLPIAGGGERLLTSAGKYGAMVTDIRLTFDRPGGRLGAMTAANVIIQGEPIDSARLKAPLVRALPIYRADAEIAALIERYRAAASGEADRSVGRLGGALTRTDDIGKEHTAPAFIADAQLFVAREVRRGKADFALINNGGARTDLLPEADGTVRLGQIYAMQPYSNSLVTKSFTGAEVKAILEQQFDSGSNTPARPNLLLPSANFSFAFDRSRPAGQRILAMTLDGKPIDPARSYRLAVNNFLASGGDNFTLLAGGRDPVDGGLDLDATRAYLATNPPVPVLGRVKDLTPRNWAPPSR